MYVLVCMICLLARSDVTGVYVGDTSDGRCGGLPHLLDTTARTKRGRIRMCVAVERGTLCVCTLFGTLGSIHVIMWQHASMHVPLRAATVN